MKNKSGFTLIEMIAIISIMGLIITIAIPKINEYIYIRKKDAFVLNARNILRQIEYNKIDSDVLNKMSLKDLNIKKVDSSIDLENSYVYIIDDGLYLDLKGKEKYKDMYICSATSSKKNIEVDTLPCN